MTSPTTSQSPNGSQVNGASPDGQKKRRKGAQRLSCAECRRLKLRCDRTVPCSSCVKRGTGAICPDGSLTTGQGNRFVLASTQELHEKIQELATRVRELEDGLRTSHGAQSSEVHPLLTEERLQVKMPLQREVPAFRNGVATTAKEEESGPEVIDAFGTLSIDMSGKAKYFGHPANAWYFLQNEDQANSDIEDSIHRLQTILPPEILDRAASFPISSDALASRNAIRLANLYWYLPPGEKAQELKSLFYTHAAWMYNPINLQTFNAEVYSQFYDPSAGPPVSDESVVSHRLSLMFMILAIGCLMDTSQSAYNIEAEKYHQLAKAALFQSSFFDEPTINAVQALFLMTFYLFLSDRQGTGNGSRWGIMGIAIKVAQSIGLHRDSGKWQIESDETQRRRELFWELFTYDSWQCMTFGRPPSFALVHVDTKMPFMDDSSEENTFHDWKHRFSSECMTQLHDQSFSAKTPAHSTVIQLDRKMRAFPVPQVLQVAGFGGAEQSLNGNMPSVSLILQRHIVLAFRESNLLYLHRAFFARALNDHPADPLGSPYGASVIAAYRSAGSLVALMRNLHNQLKELSERLWFLWTHMFSCAIVLGSIVTRCPSMSLAPSAMVQLDSACQLFGAAAEGFRAGKVLGIMQHLQKKAHKSLDDYRQNRVSPNDRRMSSDGRSLSPEDDDELAILGGQTRLVGKKDAVLGSPTIVDRSPNSQNPVVPLPLSPSSHQVHPSITEYLSSFSAPMDMDQHIATFSAGSSGRGSFSDEISPVSNYSLSPSTPFRQQTEPSSYFPNHHANSMSPSSPHVPHHIMGNTNGNTSMNGHNPSFPSYFPVYDYGTPSMSNGYGHAPPMLDMRPTPQSIRGSTSTESSLQNTWQDFINSAMN